VTIEASVLDVQVLPGSVFFEYVKKLVTNYLRKILTQLQQLSQ